jgi:hypothetical protein
VVECVVGRTNPTEETLRKRQSTILASTAGAAGVASVVSALVLGAAAVPASARSHDTPVYTIARGFDGPRGVATVGRRATIVAEADGTINLVRERRHQPAKVRRLTRVPALFAPAVARGRHGIVYILTGAATDPDASAPKPPKAVARAEKKLFRWRPGWARPHLMANIGAYQKRDPDPFDQEKLPTDSNPFGVAALPGGSVLVTDAAGNDLLKVRPNGRVSTVAMLRPRTVKVPTGLPATGPDGSPLPPAGTPIPSEAVATSVTVGRDGYYYVGELRGFPATPGTSQIWRIHPRARHVVCNPKHPAAGPCKRFADGLTSIVDLAPAKRGSVYALSLSKKSWLQLESGAKGANVGGLFRVTKRGHRIHELAVGRFKTPGAVDTTRNGRIAVTGPVFGSGRLFKLHP